MRDLVIGSDGFVGRPLCRFLKLRGDDVIKIDIKRGKAHDARSITLDLKNVDRVYFLAWDVGGAKYLYDGDTQLYQLEWNLKLLSNLMPQLSDIPFVFVSSQLAEEVDSVYGVQKRLGEVWTRLTKRGFATRFWNVYGAYEPPSVRSHVVCDFVYQALTRGKIEMMTSGDESRQFIHIDDICEALISGFEQNVRGVYDISSFHWVKVSQIAHIIGAYTGVEVIPGGKEGTTVRVPNKPAIPGWSARVDLEDGLKRLVDFYRWILDHGYIED